MKNKKTTINKYISKIRLQKISCIICEIELLLLSDEISKKFC